MNYFQLHIGDYEKATAHLTAAEDGIYNRLLRRYYDTEQPIPADIKAVQRLVRARSKDEREAVETVLSEFFSITPDGWRHGRCDEEIEAYKAKKDKARSSANARWSKGGRNANASDESVRTHSERNANASETQCDGNANQEPITNNQKDQKQKKGRASAPACPDDVDPQTWADWLALRKAKRAPVTETVLREARKEADKAGMALGAFLAIWCRRGSQGLEADWLKPSERQGHGPPAAPVGKQMAGIIALEELKNATRNRMAAAGSGDGHPETFLPVAGPNAGR